MFRTFRQFWSLRRRRRVAMTDHVARVARDTRPLTTHPVEFQLSTRRSARPGGPTCSATPTDGSERHSPAVLWGVMLTAITGVYRRTLPESPLVAIPCPTARAPAACPHLSMP